ncbi:MAG: hypothetical protein EOO81_11000 [Oxalobacteraceae bacterium]|nr:MAG: hypothetical protein EOO81_11000 [Oxalobacteraceae bacterium]
MTSPIVCCAEAALQRNRTTEKRPIFDRVEIGSTGVGRLATMQLAFSKIGDVCSGDAVSVLLQARTNQPISLLARWIVDRNILSFEEHGERWIPMFQFAREDMSIKNTVQTIICELRDVFDDWELVEWFATPNAVLFGERPADVAWRGNPSAIEAARLDRFVATG